MVQSEKKEELFRNFKELQKEQDVTAKELEEKYGSGNINLTNGEISPIE